MSPASLVVDTPYCGTNDFGVLYPETCLLSSGNAFAPSKDDSWTDVPIWSVTSGPAMD